MRVSRSHRLVALGVLALVTAAGCSEAEEKAARARTVAACPDGLDTNSVSEQLPSDFPTLSGSRLYRLETLGKTRIWFATLDGGAEDIVPVRDRIVGALKDQGYDIEGTDQEKGAEAEAQFKGPHVGTVRTRPLCKGHVEVRYKLES